MPTGSFDRVVGVSAGNADEGSALQFGDVLGVFEALLCKHEIRLALNLLQHLAKSSLSVAYVDVSPKIFANEVGIFLNKLKSDGGGIGNRVFFTIMDELVSKSWFLPDLASGSPLSSSSSQPRDRNLCHPLRLDPISSEMLDAFCIFEGAGGKNMSPKYRDSRSTNAGYGGCENDFSMQETRGSPSARSKRRLDVNTFGSVPCDYSRSQTNGYDVDVAPLPSSPNPHSRRWVTSLASRAKGVAVLTSPELPSKSFLESSDASSVCSKISMSGGPDSSSSEKIPNTTPKDDDDIFAQVDVRCNHQASHSSRVANHLTDTMESPISVGRASCRHPDPACGHQRTDGHGSQNDRVSTIESDLTIGRVSVRIDSSGGDSDEKARASSASRQHRSRHHQEPQSEMGVVAASKRRFRTSSVGIAHPRRSI